MHFLDELSSSSRTAFTRSFAIPGCNTFFFLERLNFRGEKNFSLHYFGTWIRFQKPNFLDFPFFGTNGSTKIQNSRNDGWIFVMGMLQRHTVALSTAYSGIQQSHTHKISFTIRQKPRFRDALYFTARLLDFSSILFFSFPLFCASFELWGAATSRSTFHLNFACTAVLFIFFSFFFSCQTNFHTQRTSFIREEISILASKFSFTAHFDCTPRAPHTITRANCEREQLNTETLHTGFWLIRTNYPRFT